MKGDDNRWKSRGQERDIIIIINWGRGLWGEGRSGEARNKMECLDLFRASEDGCELGEQEYAKWIMRRRLGSASDIAKGALKQKLGRGSRWACLLHRAPSLLVDLSENGWSWFWIWFETWVGPKVCGGGGSGSDTSDASTSLPTLWSLIFLRRHYKNRIRRNKYGKKKNECLWEKWLRCHRRTTSARSVTFQSAQVRTGKRIMNGRGTSQGLATKADGPIWEPATRNVVTEKNEKIKQQRLRIT